MGTKTRPGPYDCYAAAEPDEPMFVLLGRDPFAGFLVRLWILGKGKLPSGDAADAAKNRLQLANAHACAEELDAWARKLGKTPSAPPLQPAEMAELYASYEPLALDPDGGD